MTSLRTQSWLVPVRPKRLQLLCLVSSVLCLLAASASAAGADPVSSPDALEPVGVVLGAPFPKTATPSPEEVSLDSQSRTAFSALTQDAAITLARRTFGIDRPSWTAPGQDKGAPITKYLGEKSAVETLPSGQHLVVGSTVPLRAMKDGVLSPVDLTPRDEGGTFAPGNALVPITISKTTAATRFSTGISVAPPSSESLETPTVAGHAVVFANSARDTDLVVEPVPQGAELSWQLRSQDSPADEALNFDLPSEASLRMSTEVAGAAEVVAHGQQLLLVLPAIARGADGRPVPVSYTVSGQTLTTHVDLSGPVDFPVLVDPLLTGNYGTTGGANVWNGWHHYDTCGGCFGTLEFSNLIQTGANPGPALGNYGVWEILAPGAGTVGGAGIARVDLVGVTHEAFEQSSIQASVNHSFGSTPSYSLNGFVGKTGLAPLNTGAVYSNQSIAFCAQNGGGHDGGEQPLCDENYAAQGFYFLDQLGPNAGTVFNYVRIAGAQIVYDDEVPPNKVEWINTQKSGWNQNGPTDDYILASDQGLGVQRFELSLPAGKSPAYFTENLPCNAPNGFVGCPFTERSANIDLSTRPTGVYEVGATALDAAGRGTLEGAGPPANYPKLYIDHDAPTTTPLTGTLAEAANSTIGNGSYTLHFSAEDGGPGLPQSGVSSFQVLVDGRVATTVNTTCPKPVAIPASNCFGLSGEWTMNGQSYGAGAHTISVLTKDWVGNTSTQTLHVTFNEAANQQLGPGSVDLETGDFKLSATDVSLAGANATLALSRSYDSRGTSEGALGPLGAPWQLSVPDGETAAWQSLTPLSEGSVGVYAANGEQLIFAPKAGGGWVSPAGFQTDTLTEPSTSPAVYQITDASGNYTKFTQPGSEARFVPSTVAQVQGAGGLNRVSYSFTKTASGIVEPTKVLGPEPSEGACTATLVKGCRALTFNYAASTTATGEGKAEWGDYKEHLTRVYFTAWDPSQSKMTETVVAQYAYDLQGRLRAEWDPRISPALKTYYGYDGENHVTALTPPGQETWAFHYGAIPTDLSTGRLLSLNRPSASAPLWGGEAVKNTAAPVLSGSAVVGVKMSVTNGTWSGNPAAYAYRWQDCDAAGGNCVAIRGATNPTYTLGSGDQQHTLVAQVIATNGAGSIVAASAASALVKTGTGTEGAAPPAAEPRWTVEYRVPLSGSGLPDLTAAKVGQWGQKDLPTAATAIFPPDEPQSWPATDYKRASLYYLDSRSRTVNLAAPNGGISTTEYDTMNNVTRSLSPDNRATALAAGSKSVETAEAIDSKSTYSADGTELESTLGPQHNVKLANGSEVLARKHTVYSYDEGAPSGGPYRLVTKTTEGAQIAGQEEKDVRTIKTSYSGQENLGWKLHAPTSSTSDPSGLALLHKTVYDPATGNVVEDSSPAANSETIYPPAYSSSFAAEGTGNGQLKTPGGEATDSSGNFWVIDRGNNRVEKFSPSGAFIAAYGTKGSGNLQFSSPWGIAINQSTGDVYIADTENNRIEKLSSTGAFVASFTAAGATGFKEPIGVALDSSGHVWTTDWGHNRIVELEAQGTFMREAGSLGAAGGQFSGPGGIAISEGSIFVADGGNNRIEQFSPTGAYLGQFGTKGSGAGQFKEPYAIAANPSTGALYVSDPGNSRMEEFSPAGRFLTEWATWGPKHQVTTPGGLAIATSGKLYIADQLANQVTTWTPPETGAAHLTYASQYGSSGSGNGQFSTPIATAVDGAGGLWTTDYGNNRVEKFSAKGSFIASYGSAGSGNGQFFGPGGIDINQSTGEVYVADTNGHRIEVLSSTGAFIRAFGAAELTRPGSIKLDSAGHLWVPDMTQNRLVEYSSTGTFMAAYGKEGSGPVQFKQPAAVAFSGENVYVSDAGNHRVQELTNTGAFIREWGIEGGGSGELYAPEGISADSAGNLYVVDDGASHVEEFTASGVYRGTFATKGTGEGQLTAPVGNAIDAAGSMYVVDTSDNRVEKWTAVNLAAHITKTLYYSAGANAEYPACGNHAEWAGLGCQGQPAQQPQARGLPNLPVTSYTYNVWDEPLTTTDTVGSTTRTTTLGYDAAGRATTSAISSSVGTPVPMTTSHYSETTGALIEQSTTTRSLKSKYNNLGQLETYTDADANTSTASYDVDGRLEKTSDGKGTQAFGYDTKTGFLATLTDSAAGTFTASYDAEGKSLVEGYPNGMTATRTYDQRGAPTKLEYVKTTHCSSGCTWYSDAAVASIHDQWLSQASTLSSLSYAYDGVGRLREVQATPTAGGCTSRLYGYEEDGNRTSLTTRAPGAEGKCSTEGGAVERHAYDEGDRLIDEGATYDAFGNTTALPGVDAGGTELTSAYYVDNALASQKQNGQTITYGRDPAGRTREAISAGTKNSTVVSHFSGAGDSPTWTIDGAGIWTRYLGGIGGGLAAIQTNGAAPILQLANLHGDIVATAAISETETKLLSTTDTTEYGVPTTASPTKYSWLGGAQRSTELPSGVIAMGARGYVPQLGRFEQPDPHPGGSVNAYSYTTDDPVNSADPGGELGGTIEYNVGSGDAGAAVAGLSEHFIVPGAIMPPPVNQQIEAESNAHPSWTAAAVESTTLHIGAGGAAIAAFSRTFRIGSLAAIGLGSAMGVTGSIPNALELSFAGVPTWAFRLLESIVHHDVREVGEALGFAGARSLDTPQPYVSVNIHGSVRYGVYDIRITWLEHVFYP